VNAKFSREKVDFLPKNSGGGKALVSKREWGDRQAEKKMPITICQ